MGTSQSTGQWKPTYRRLRAYAFDPSMASALDTAVLNEATLNVIWESDLGPGPIGEYLEALASRERIVQCEDRMSRVDGVGCLGHRQW